MVRPERVAPPFCFPRLYELVTLDWSGMPNLGMVSLTSLVDTIWPVATRLEVRSLFACICHAVTEDQIGHAIDSGAGSIEAVGLQTGAGTGCGTCHDRIDELIELRCGSCPLAALQVA
ncbi:BFD-like [2Fe-2S] binding domain-containing protein [Frankineae bacterium MT45]|nr:BFD-like [2Fe-2S] binding domain-containing protein [Frankineae bacterium MT45]